MAVARRCFWLDHALARKLFGWLLSRNAAAAVQWRRLRVVVHSSAPPYVALERLIFFSLHTPAQMTRIRWGDAKSEWKFIYLFLLLIAQSCLFKRKL